MRRRVLQLITRLPVGGAERLIVDIVRRLDRARYEPLVCCIQARGELAAEVESAGVRVLCLGKMRSKRFDWSAVRALRRLLLEERIDLVHSHLYHANLYGRLAAWRAGVPAVATVHNTYAATKLHRRWINRLLSRVSARVVAVSEDIRDDLIRHDGVRPEKIVTIHNGIDPARVESALSRDEARGRLGLQGEPIVLGCVGRLEEQKGHRFLLEALALLRRDAALGERLRLLIVGDGRLRQALEAQAAALGVASATSFLGMRQDIAQLLKAMDLYVMPSLWEGLSVAMLEAMAARLPVIISDVGGVSLVAGNDEFALRVPPGDVAALAGAIARLCRNPDERRALGLRARQRVLERFSAAAMLRELTAVYEAALAR